MLRFSAKQNKSGVLFILKLVVKEQKIKLKVNKLQSCTNQQHMGSRNTKKSREQNNVNIDKLTKRKTGSKTQNETLKKLPK